MVWLIAKKELAENLLTFRFSLGMLILVLLIPLLTWLGIRDYNRRFEEYQTQAKQVSEWLENSYFYNDVIRGWVQINRPPEPLSILGRGISGQLSTRMNINITQIPNIFSQNQSVVQTQRAGFTHIIKPADPLWLLLIVIALLCMIFSYNSISGEKEDRSLAMAFSSSLSRFTFFFGKYLGLLITIIIPLIVGLLLAVLTLLFLAPGLLKGDDYLRIVLVFLVLAIYGSVFLTIGILVSASVHRSSTSLASLLFIWLLLVVLFPQASIYLGRTVYTMPVRLVMYWHTLQGVNKEFEDQHDLNLPEYPWMPIADHFNSVNYWPMYGSLRVNTPLPRKWMDDLLESYQRMLPRLKTLANMRFNAVQSNWTGIMLNQTELTRSFERISPLGATRHLAEALLDVDYGSYLHFLQDCRRYRETILSYHQNKLNSDPYRVISRFEGENLPGEREFLTQVTGGEYKSLADVLQDLKNGENDKSAVNSILKNKYESDKEPQTISLDDLPVFNSTREPFASIITRTLNDLAFLLVGHLFLFALGFVLVTRYDPR